MNWYKLAQIISREISGPKLGPEIQLPIIDEISDEETFEYMVARKELKDGYYTCADKLWLVRGDHAEWLKEYDVDWNWLDNVARVRRVIPKSDQQVIPQKNAILPRVEVLPDPAKELYTKNNKKEFTHPIAKQMVEDFESAQKADWSNELIGDLNGVINGSQTNLDRLFDRRGEAKNKDLANKIYHHFDTSRSMLKQWYGDKIRLYRSQGQKQMIEDKNTLLWVDRNFAKRFLNKDRELITEDILIDDIVAIVLTSQRYREFVVLNRKSSSWWRPE